MLWRKNLNNQNIKIKENENIDEDILLKIENLRTYFFTQDGIVRAVDGIELIIKKGQVLGLIGETGCGKTMTALSILRLVPPPGRIIDGRILFRKDNEIINLVNLDPKGDKIREIRGKYISMIFQEPMISLNPIYTIGDQIIENIITHNKISKIEAKKIAISMLEQVGIPEPDKRIDEYPHQLSGGMRQRAMIAMALSCNPHLLIADEPTTAVDVTVQAQILDLLRKLQKTFNMSVLLITHNMGVVAELADTVGVMYLGKIVEFAKVIDLFDNPTHPYTQALLKSIPSLSSIGKSKQKLAVIKGDLPDPYSKLEGCYFKLRCPYVINLCEKEEPSMIEIENQHFVKCWLVVK
jgi:peptide/nickel transport system ATP-binding protein